MPLSVSNIKWIRVLIVCQRIMWFFTTKLCTVVRALTDYIFIVNFLKISVPSKVIHHVISVRTIQSTNILYFCSIKIHFLLNFLIVFQINIFITTIHFQRICSLMLFQTWVWKSLWLYRKILFLLLNLESTWIVNAFYFFFCKIMNKHCGHSSDMHTLWREKENFW